MGIDFEEIVTFLVSAAGDNPKREGLKETPRRFSEAWHHWTSGCESEPADVLKCFTDGAEKYDELVFQGSIPFYALCEHHLAPFFGVAHIGYLPNGKIVGLSKLARLLDIYARRLTVQERICTQVADALMKHVDARGVGVILQARHLCMESRGVSKIGTITTTSAMRGLFLKNPPLRAEFLSLVGSEPTGKPL